MRSSGNLWVSNSGCPSKGRSFPTCWQNGLPLSHGCGETESIGTIRAGLKKLKIADNTIVWFCSDNGGLSGIQPETVGGLRGFKNSMYEGGIRVPCVVEWPAVIKPRVTSYPAGTIDIFSTIRDIVGLPDSVATMPQDGTSLRALFSKEIGTREKPLVFSPFWTTG